MKLEQYEPHKNTLSINVDYSEKFDVIKVLESMIKKIKHGSVSAEDICTRYRASFRIDPIVMMELNHPNPEKVLDEVKGEIKIINGKICHTYMSRL